MIGRRCPQPDRKAGNFSVYNNALAEMQEPGASWTPRSQGSSGVLSIGRDKRLSSILVRPLGFPSSPPHCNPPGLAGPPGRSCGPGPPELNPGRCCHALPG